MVVSLCQSKLARWWHDLVARPCQHDFLCMIHVVGFHHLLKVFVSYYLNLIITKIEFFGSITFSVILLSNSARSEVTYCCNFLARLLVKGPWFILLDVSCFWFIDWIVCMDGMSASSPLLKRSHPRLYHLVTQEWR
jgi:hypothetical protein